MAHKLDDGICHSILDHIRLNPGRVVESYLKEKHGIIDNDLAELYDVDTKVLNQAVKRNIARFPEMFCFRLTIQEKDELVTNCDRFRRLLKDLGKKWFAFSKMDISFMDKLKLKNK